MEQSLSSELVKRLSQWPSEDKALPKEDLGLPVIQQEEKEESDPQVNGGEGEEGNPALEGHFLVEQTMVDVVALDSCQCNCHRDKELLFELTLPFSCSKCSQQFCCKCQFLTHRDFHRGEKKYSCQVCGKAYYYKSDLVRHQPVHSSVKPHSCKVCGRSFNQVGHLITHRLVHTGEKPFACDVCHKPFNRKSNLQKHKMIHTGERPFLCLVCGSRFSRKGDLQRHTMLHTGERPFKCEICDKSFSQKPHLVSHQSVHTGERPYKCVACTKSFNRKSNLLKHQLTKCPAHDTSSPAAGFLAHFNHLLGTKVVEISESATGEPRYFDGLELKPVVTFMEASDESNSELPLPSTVDTSMLRARLTTLDDENSRSDSSRDSTTQDKINNNTSPESV